ncbi:MAG: hypothetical protein GX601_14040, partial [Anaerolineales bacterium]|nr:hypothetical protein [Anaerolineales bacterium]
DFAHTALYGSEAALKDWFARVAPRLVHCHVNNNRGRYDDHLPLDVNGSAINYRDGVLPLLAAMPSAVWLVLEMGSLNHLERSLCFLGR